MKKFNNVRRKTKNERRNLFLSLVTFCVLLLSSSVLAQFTTEYDTLVIISGDSSTVVGWDYDASADTSGGTPYTNYTAGIDLDGKHIVGIDFDTTSAFTATSFGVQTSATYNADADTAGGTPYDWKTVYYDGTIVTLTPQIGAINTFVPAEIYGLKRYVRFICLNGSSAWLGAEAAHRKLIALLRSGY